MKLGKRGQATVFIILGILLVATLGTVAYMQREVIKRKLATITERAVVVPPQAEKVKEYIDDCIEIVSREGAEILGMQAGYIIPPEDPIPVSSANPFSNGLYVFPGADLKVPYWFYETANGIQKTQIPTIERIQKELEGYIDANLADCLNEFVDFKAEGYEINYGNAISVAEISDNKIFLNVNFPVQIKLKDFEFEMDRFKAEIDANLGKLYKIARKILEKENRDYFLEEKTIDMMVVYDEIPLSGIDFKCSPRTWSKTNVINDFKDILAANIVYIKIKGTDYVLKESNKYFITDALTRNAPSVSVNFMYSQDWPFMVDIIPEGEILRGESFTENSAAKFLLPLFCLSNYHFVYSIKYPVLITLSKDDYNFQFATQIIIEKNQARENRITIDQAYDTKSFVCENPLTKMKVYALKVEEDETLTPVKDVDIFFNCLTAVCEIGKTQFKEAGDIYLEEKFPQCMNGLIIAEREDLHKGKALVTTNKEATISIILEPYYEKQFEIKIINKNTGTIRAPYSNEQITLQLENTEQEYSTSIVYPSETKKIKLIPGSYDVKAYIVEGSEAGIRIAEQKIESCVDIPRKGILGVIGLKDKKCTETTVPGTTLDQVMTGGEEFIWEIQRQNLAASNIVIFYVMRDKTPRTFTELNEISQNLQENSKHINFKYPKFE